MALVRDWSTGEYAPLTSPTILDLLPELSDEEKQRMGWLRRLPEREEDIITSFPPSSPSMPRAGSYDASIMPIVCDALRHYNARHPGGEFDAVKPLSEKGMHFRGEPWSHVNFWARSRSSKKIKRFFAEVHYKFLPFFGRPSVRLPCIATVETCSIIEEPLAQYKRSCAFCESHLDILHPMNDSEFVCGSGNEEDWYVHQLFGLRFFCRKGEALPFPFSQYS